MSSQVKKIEVVGVGCVVLPASCYPDGWMGMDMDYMI
jgi:hypothetical protein